MPDPKYRVIAEDLRSQIESGELKGGGQLPTEIALMDHYSASRNTIRDAIKWLTNHDLVETRPGQGTFVKAKISPYVTTLTDPETGSGTTDAYIQEVTAQRRKPKATPPRVEIQEADDRVAGDLQLTPGDSVVSRHQQRFIDDTPWSLQTSFYPMTLVEGGAIRLMQAANIDEGAVDYLRKGLGKEQVGWRDTITVRAPDANETTYFRLPDDGRVSVIETRRAAFDQTGTPVRLTVSVYPADRNSFVLNVGKVPREIADPTLAAADETSVADASAELDG
jgi:GntR family transcriptional regulator